MKDEIKEILDELKNEDNYIEDYGFRYKRIALDDVWHLLDYITNLQEENRKLKKEKDTLLNSLFITRNKYNNDKARYRRKAKNYKARIDKAIEYIKKHCDYGYAGQKCLTDDLYCYEAEELLEILQGKSDE